MELITRSCKCVNATFTNNKNRHGGAGRSILVVIRSCLIAFKNLCDCTKISNINVDVGCKYHSNVPRIRRRKSPRMLANFSVNPCGCGRERRFLKCDIWIRYVKVAIINHVALCNQKLFAICNNCPSHFVINRFKAIAICNHFVSLRSRRVKVVGSRKNRRARGRHACTFGTRVSPSCAPALSCAHYFHAPAAQATIL